MPHSLRPSGGLRQENGQSRNRWRLRQSSLTPGSETPQRLSLARTLKGGSRQRTLPPWRRLTRLRRKVRTSALCKRKSARALTTSHFLLQTLRRRMSSSLRSKRTTRARWRCVARLRLPSAIAVRVSFDLSSRAAWFQSQHWCCCAQGAIFGVLYTLSKEKETEVKVRKTLSTHVSGQRKSPAA